MKFNVPLEKNSSYDELFFFFLSDRIGELASETGKRPDKITFIGRLGKELMDIIDARGWDMAIFNPTHVISPLDKIVIEYTKPIDQTSDLGDLGIASGDSLDGMTMKGIPGPSAVNKLINHSIGANFKIERRIRPKLEIKLHR